MDKDLLNGKCRRTDGFGDGYTLNLPWPTYRPDIGQVKIRMRYDPAKGTPLFHDDLLTLNNGAGVAPAYTHRTETGNHQPVVTAPPAPAGSVQQAVYTQPAGTPPAQPPQQASQQVGTPPMGGIQPAGGVPPAGAAPAGALQPAFQLMSPPQPPQPPPGELTLPAGSLMRR
jgi:hypothetical protein